VFPLPNVILFPGSILPLHIFEQRYRQMVEDLLDRPGWLAMGNIREDAYEDIAGSPPVYPVAGLGEIARHKRLADGRFLIWLVGLRRVRLTEIESDRLYRRAEAEILEENAPTESESERLRPELSRAIQLRAKSPVQLGDSMPVALLADVLLQCLPLAESRVQELFSELSVADRAEAALVEHGRLPLPAKD
jgi:Lon protease-like protein